jgi:hypothetical protein
MPLHAGLDCSGTPDLLGTGRGHNPYVVVIAAVVELEILTRLFEDSRRRFGMRQNAEFHGHSMSEQMLLAVLENAEETGLVVGALLVDKLLTQQARPAFELPSGADFQIEAALALAETFFAHHSLFELRCDEDIRGERQKKFITSLKRLHRAVWPDDHIKVQFRPSEKSDLIQLADVIAYGLGNQARQTVEDEELRRRLIRISGSEKNIIEGPKAWDK